MAAQKALGAAEAAGADVGIGTTGVAGPGGGTPACPVGTVCMAASLGAQVRTMTRRYEHCTRDQVRARAASDALLLAASLLPEQK